MRTRRIGIVTPVLDDWASLGALLGALSDLIGLIARPTVFVVDDGSAQPCDLGGRCSARGSAVSKSSRSPPPWATSRPLRSGWSRSRAAAASTPSSS
ncbi:hypothetical protein [Falsiroseomonas sp. HW251]|uniref:hypothetical protein n=1 Tax=Falsiroseomonas sp. HW251 TaxID=3390998 RepID=UPI003D32037C